MKGAGTKIEWTYRAKPHLLSIKINTDVPSVFLFQSVFIFIIHREMIIASTDRFLICNEESKIGNLRHFHVLTVSIHSTQKRVIPHTNRGLF